MNLPEISIKRPSLIVVLFAILMLGGLVSYTLLNYELIAKFEYNVITITTVYPGASPSEVENTITKKIEDAVSSMENIKQMSAQSFENVSVVVIQLSDGIDVDYSVNDAQRKVNAIVSDLPADAKTPSINKFSVDNLPIMQVAARSDMIGTKFYDLLDKKIQPELSRVPGVAQVNIIGGLEREIQVNIDQKKLEGYGISLLQVQQAVLSSNLDFPTGNIKTRENTIVIRLSGKYKTVDELRNMVISSSNGVQVRLSDVADVQDRAKDIEKVARFNQHEAVVIQILKQSDANAVAVCDLIRAKLASLENDYKAQNLELNVASDQSVFTISAANHVMEDLKYAIALVAIVMLLFLHSIRNAVIAMISIPASLIATFIGIYALGYTLNVMSLVGLSLVVGILVDDAIVVLENIHRHMEMGKNKVRAAYDGTTEIMFTVMSITLVIIVVFIPITIINQYVTNVLKQFCVTVMIATGFSLLSSFTIVPWLSSRFGKLRKISGKDLLGKFFLRFEAAYESFARWISNVLVWCLKDKINKLITLGIATALFIGSILLLVFGFIGTDFFPQLDRGEFVIRIELPKDVSLEQTNFMLQKAESYLTEKKEVVSFITTIVGGQVSGGLSVRNIPYQGEINVKLRNKTERKDNVTVYAAKVKRELEDRLVGAKVTAMPIGMNGNVDRAQLQLVVTGISVDSAMVFAKKAEAALTKIEGATQVDLSVEEGVPEINVQVNRDKMSMLGLDMKTVGATMQTAFSGNTDGKFRTSDNEYNINIRYDQYNRSRLADVDNLMFINNIGQQIKLSQFASVTEGIGPTELDRFNRSPSITINGRVVGRPAGSVAKDWEAVFSKIKRPMGVNYQWAGNMSRQNESFETLGYALLAAIILVYLIMVALYDNYIYPFVVLFTIPLSFVGALVTLALTNTSLQVFTFLGMIMLIGLVCKNAILLVDFVNHRKEAGADTKTALMQATHARLRPILMTTIAMALGMLPTAVSNSEGAELIKGLAWVIIGGLISSLFLTLVIIPVVYSIVDSLIGRFSKGEKINYAAKMTASYKHKELSDDGFTPKH